LTHARARWTLADAMPVRVLTVDDQAPFREVARDLVEVTPGFAAVGEAESGEEALVMTRSVAPDLILLDLRMSGMDGLETARRLSAEHPRAVIVLVSSGDILGLGVLAEACGAAAVLSKQRLSSRVLRGLWRDHGPDGADRADDVATVPRP
jgi:two-component system invasion response regulator UvrY